MLRLSFGLAILLMGCAHAPTSAPAPGVPFVDTTPVAIELGHPVDADLIASGIPDIDASGPPKPQ